MRISISRAWESLWVWLFWGLGIYLALELGPFFIAKQVLNKTASELAGPYLACAMPGVIFMPLVWWLRKWRERGMDSKRLARGWGVSTALFGVAVVVAVSYSGVKLSLMDPKGALGGLVVSVLLSVPVLYFTLHSMVLRQFPTGTVGKQMPRSDGASSPN
jgi:hypothetical protein